MLKPVMRAGEDGSSLVPDNLLMMQKTDPQQAIQDLAGEFRSVPDIRHFKAWHQRERLRPVGPRIGGDGRVGVASRPLLHVAGFRRSAAIQAGAVTPLGVELDSVWWIGHH